MDYDLIANASDDSVLIRFEERIDPKIASKVRNAGISVRNAALPWVTEIIPSYNELLVVFDQCQVAPAEALNAIAETVKGGDVSAEQKPRLFRIPVCYGGELGPDIGNVCDYTGLAEEEVIRLHSAPEYLIYMIGFTIGFPYLGGMDPRLETPRLEKPRSMVPRGSVGIGGKHTGIYSLDTPGGWQIIGRSPVELVDIGKMPPSLLSAGDYVKFVPIASEEYEEIGKAVSSGSYSVASLAGEQMP